MTLLHAAQAPGSTGSKLVSAIRIPVALAGMDSHMMWGLDDAGDGGDFASGAFAHGEMWKNVAGGPRIELAAVPPHVYTSPPVEGVVWWLFSVTSPRV